MKWVNSKALEKIWEFREWLRGAMRIKGWAPAWETFLVW